MSPLRPPCALPIAERRRRLERPVSAARFLSGFPHLLYERRGFHLHGRKLGLLSLLKFRDERLIILLEILPMPPGPDAACFSDPPIPEPYRYVAVRIGGSPSSTHTVVASNARYAAARSFSIGTVASRRLEILFVASTAAFRWPIKMSCGIDPRRIFRYLISQELLLQQHESWIGIIGLGEGSLPGY